MIGAKRFGSQSEICIRRTARTMFCLEGVGSSVRCVPSGEKEADAGWSGSWRVTGVF